MDLKELTKRVELRSKHYTKSNNIKRDRDWFVFKLQEEIGELTQSYLILTKRGRLKGKATTTIAQEFEDEVADVLCHLLLLANHYNIDLEKAVNNKWLVLENKEKISNK